MDHSQILADAARRPIDTARVVLDGISPKMLKARPGGAGNPIAWLVWHSARQMDVQLAELTGEPTVWERDGWAERLQVDRPDDDFGLGDGPEEVAALQIDDATKLLALLESCVAALVTYVDGLSAEELDQIVDESWEPPVSRGVRLVSIIDDAAAHLGQAAYARGLLEGWQLGV
ncbi:mycothiol transferase [Luteococcus sp. Sow4_B9]|uniref:mycothiol transferase n=1 Tax=Luteococcus sp. Sow4_B9 TaxID=3438792 RepID=UPI003F9D45F3